MPRTSRCPTCDTNVKVPDTAPRGALVRCPNCEETFQPPFLKPATVADEDDAEDEYDPKTAERFGMKGVRGRNASKEYERERKRKAREEREREGPPPKPQRGLFDSPDLFWLCSAFALAVIVFAGWYGLRYRDNPEVAASRSLFVVAGLIAAMFIGVIIWMILAGMGHQSHRRN